MKWYITNEARSAELVMIISYPASPSRIIVFLKPDDTYLNIWESEEEKCMKGTQLWRKAIENNHFSIKCNKQNGRENLSTCCNVSGQSWMNSIKLAEENVKASLLRKKKLERNMFLMEEYLWQSSKRWVSSSILLPLQRGHGEFYESSSPGIFSCWIKVSRRAIILFEGVTKA